jgi:hypothetical protein
MTEKRGREPKSAIRRRRNRLKKAENFQNQPEIG